jgi:signal transduction histidine kinase/ligand-binding sensor domain-containing protein
VHWRGAEASLLRLLDGMLTRFGTEDGLPDAWVWDLAEDPSGRLIVATETGVAVLPPGARRFETLIDGGRLPAPFVTSLALERGGAIWMGTTRGLARAVGERVQPVEAIEGAVRDIMVARDGAIWVTGNRTTVRLVPGDREPAVARTYETGQTERVIEDRDGQVWSAGVGLRRLWPSLLRFENELGIPGHGVWSAFEDREGSLWVGTRTSGALQLHAGAVVNLKNTELAADEVGFAVIRARDGSMWIAHTRGVSQWRGGHARHLRAGQEVGWAMRSLAEDPAGRLWAASLDGALYEIDGARIARHEIPGKRVPAALAFSPSGALWVTFENGLSEFPGGRPGPEERAYGLAQGLCAGPLTSLMVRPDGGIWAGSFADGLVVGDRHPDGKLAWRCLRRSDGLASSGVGGLFLDREGVLWLGGLEEAGLTILRDGRLSPIALAIEDRPARVLGITHVGRDVWLTSDRGIARAPRADLLAQALGAEPAKLVVYGTNEGLLNAEGIALHFPNVAAGASHDVWMATLGGVAIIKAESETKPVLQVFVEEIALGERALDVATPVSFVRGAPALTVRFTAPTFLLPERLRFRVSLAGLPEMAANVTRDRTMTLVSLPTGSYRLNLQALDEAGRVVATGLGPRMNVRPRFVETVWFALVMSALVASVVLLGVRLRWMQLDRRMRLLHEERQRIARDLHDGLAQGLTSAVYLMESMNAHPPPGGNVLANATKLLRHCQGALRLSIASLRGIQRPSVPLDLVVSRLFDELSVAARTRLDVRFTGRAHGIAADVVLDVEYALREGVANADKHAGASAIEAVVTAHKDEVVIVVKDNGGGVVAGARVASDGLGGLGLTGLRERTRSRGGTVHLQTEAGRGTTLTVRLPFVRERAVLDRGESADEGAGGTGSP